MVDKIPIRESIKIVAIVNRKGLTVWPKKARAYISSSFLAIRLKYFEIYFSQGLNGRDDSTTEHWVQSSDNGSMGGGTYKKKKHFLIKQKYKNKFKINIFYSLTPSHHVKSFPKYLNL